MIVWNTHELSKTVLKHFSCCMLKIFLIVMQVVDEMGEKEQLLISQKLETQKQVGTLESALAKV